MKFLEKLRKERKLSRAAAVRLMENVPEGTLNYWETKAQDMSARGLWQIKKAYNVSWSELGKLLEEEFKDLK